jgi:hypothetical protein
MNPTSLNHSIHPALTFGQQGKHSTLKAGVLSLALLGAGVGVGYVANNQPSKSAVCDQPAVSIDSDGTAVTSLSCEPDRVEIKGKTCQKMSDIYPALEVDEKGQIQHKDVFLCRTTPDTTTLPELRQQLNQPRKAQ